MKNNINNWSYKRVTNFLKANGFKFDQEIKGKSIWIKMGDKGGPGWIVELPFRKDHYPKKTMKHIIRTSGIVEQDWIEWNGS